MLGKILIETDWAWAFLLFLAYSIGGWVAETTVGIIKNKKFTNKGFLNGPYCTIYGVAALIVTVGFAELKNSWTFLFIGSMVLCTVIEWSAAKCIEKLMHMRLWDYSDKKFNLDGYICLQYSVLWGIAGVVGVKYVNRFLHWIYQMISGTILDIGLWIIFGIIVVDILGSYFAARGISDKYPRVTDVNNRLTSLRIHMGNWMAKKMDERLSRAYPMIQKKREQTAETKVFAAGCGFYKLFLLFIIGAFLGDITETIYCRLAGGVWMSRSSVVWGPFSIVWGLGIMFATAFLYNYRDKSDSSIFCFGTIMGGVYEYLCSVFTELAFGQVFWDYSNMPFNLGGRINLLYCFFWGIAAVVWIKKLFPFVSGWIEKIPVKQGKIITWVLCVFMICNILMSGIVLVRYTERNDGVESKNRVDKWLDVHYDNERVEWIYPNMTKAD